MERKRILLVSAIVLVGTLSACAPGYTDEDSSPAASTGTASTSAVSSSTASIPLSEVDSSASVIPDDGTNKTVKVKLYKAGWGEDWLTEMISAFEKTYAAEGYKVEVVESSSTVPTTTEQELLLGPAKNDIDLYFSGQTSIPTVLSRTKKVLKSEATPLLYSFDTLLDEPCIGSSKLPEKDTLRSRMFKGYSVYDTYEGDMTQWDGQCFSLSWANNAVGLFVNPSVLSQYNLETPLTSDEFVADLKTISAKSDSTGVYPYAWAGNNAPGYWQYLFCSWFGQYSGVDNFNKWVSLDNDNRTDGYKVYEDSGILESLKAMHDTLNLNYSENGAVNMTHLEMQDRFLRGKAAFVVSGDWLLNEMSGEYLTEAQNVEMMKTPILSSIGTEIGVTDSELHTIVKGIDDGEDDATIKGKVASLTDAGLTRVRSARHVYASIGVDHQVLVPSYSDALTATSYFLRFMYSADGCRIFHAKARGTLPFSYDQTAEEIAADSAFEKSVRKVTENGTGTIIDENPALSVIRSKASMLSWNNPKWRSATTWKTVMLNISDSAYSAQAMYEGEAEYEKNQWSTYISYLG
jgi:ABC-type glycerol-3-phosphate transport system substrate-binding protein